MDNLILAPNDDDNDDKDGKDVQLHVDVGKHFQFLDENIPSGDDPLNVEVPMNKSMTNHSTMLKQLRKNANCMGGQMFCHHITTIFHYVDINAL